MYQYFGAIHPLKTNKTARTTLTLLKRRSRFIGLVTQIYQTFLIAIPSSGKKCDDIQSKCEICIRKTTLWNLNTFIIIYNMEPNEQQKHRWSQHFRKILSTKFTMTISNRSFIGTRKIECRKKNLPSNGSSVSIIGFVRSTNSSKLLQNGMFLPSLMKTVNIFNT